MKREFATEMWMDPWFQQLEIRGQWLWFYLIGNCDLAGVIEVGWPMVNFIAGPGLNYGPDDLKCLGDRVREFKPGKWQIVKFVEFQYGNLSRDCWLHRKVLALLDKHGLTTNSCHTTAQDVPSPKVQVQVRVQGGKESAERKGYAPEVRVALHYLNEKSHRAFRETAANLDFIAARLAEAEVTIEGVRQMIDRQCKRWLGTSQAEYLRPETLFNKTKFDGYYAARELPIDTINETNSRNNPKGVDRNEGTLNAGRSGDYAGVGTIGATVPVPHVSGTSAHSDAPSGLAIRSRPDEKK